MPGKDVCSLTLLPFLWSLYEVLCFYFLSDEVLASILSSGVPIGSEWTITHIQPSHQGFFIVSVMVMGQFAVWKGVVHSLARGLLLGLLKCSCYIPSLYQFNTALFLRTSIAVGICVSIIVCYYHYHLQFDCGNWHLQDSIRIYSHAPMHVAFPLMVKDMHSEVSVSLPCCLVCATRDGGAFSSLWCHYFFYWYAPYSPNHCTWQCAHSLPSSPSVVGAGKTAMYAMPCSFFFSGWEVLIGVSSWHCGFKSQFTLHENSVTPNLCPG